MGEFIAAFGAYDIRGKVPSELNADLAYRVARAFSDEVKPKTVCIGRDPRISGPELYEALRKGFNESGVDVVNLEMVGTEMVYFATAKYGYDGGIMITASHNPVDQNGLKMVRKESVPISSASGLNEIESRAFHQKWERHGQGSETKKDVYDDFVQHLLTIVPPESIKAMNVLCDAGNGGAGVALEKLLPHLSLNVTKRHFKPDGNFPNEVPNPIEELAAVRDKRRHAIVGARCRFGVAWDGDYDRCFFYDENGEFIEGYYFVGLFAEAFLKKESGQTIIYDPRLTWNTLEIVKNLGGKPEMCRSGHAFIKEMMRKEDAIYGGEMSAHHYFKQHWYCDSGMIPFLLVASILSSTDRSLSQLVGDMVKEYPCSGEINSKVNGQEAVQQTLDKVEAHYGGMGGKVDKTDGLSIEFEKWRFNLRGSNTQPMIRLNVETRADLDLLSEKTEELLAMIRG